MNEQMDERELQALNSVLTSIRVADVGKTAPPGLQIELLAAFRARNRKKSLITRYVYAIGAAAACIVLAVFLVLQAPPPVEQSRSKPVQYPRRDSGFIPVPYSPAMTVFDRGQVLRVSMPRSSLRTLGFPVNEERSWERIEAEVLLGEDGIARAIRVVR